MEVRIRIVATMINKNALDAVSDFFHGISGFLYAFIFAVLLIAIITAALILRKILFYGDAPPEHHKRQDRRSPGRGRRPQF